MSRYVPQRFEEWLALIRASREQPELARLLELRAAAFEEGRPLDDITSALRAAYRRGSESGSRVTQSYQEEEGS